MCLNSVEMKFKKWPFAIFWAPLRTATVLHTVLITMPFDRRQNHILSNSFVCLTRLHKINLYPIFLQRITLYLARLLKNHFVFWLFLSLLKRTISCTIYKLINLPHVQRMPYASIGKQIRFACAFEDELQQKKTLSNDICSFN